MTPLEREARALLDSLLALPASVEKEIGLRAVRHGLSLLSRDIISASDAIYRGRRMFDQAQNNLRKAS
jgi:hypothetical protein